MSAPPEARPTTATLTIDGMEVTVPLGIMVIDAAKQAGIDIPHLCYHPQLPPFAGCRMCLVEVEGVPKLLASCDMPVRDGMVVSTETEKCQSQRAGVIEMILLNHPLDCPVCDKGGECELQEATFRCSTGTSRVTEPKIHTEDYDLGPLIVRNQDRCIICKRCIQVMEDIVGERVIEFTQRGVTMEIATFEHSEFRAGFSGNTIRVCPVGALMSKPFRFRARPWELIKTPSICTGCAVGCSYRVDTRENQILRVVGLENKPVNDAWLCDRGQFGYDWVQHEDRLTAPLIKRNNGEFEEASWSEALSLVASRLKSVKDAHGGSAIGGLAAPTVSNEDLFAFQRLLRETLESNNLDYRSGGQRTGYAAWRPQPGEIEKLGQADVILLFATDLTADAPVLDLITMRAVKNAHCRVIIAHPRETRLRKFAGHWLRYQPGQEIALLNALTAAALETADADVLASLGEAVQEVRQGLSSPGLAEMCQQAGVSEDDVRQAASVFGSGSNTAIVYGSDCVEASDGGAILSALRNFALISGQADGQPFLEAVTDANTWGARDLGVTPDAGPGGAGVERGLNTDEMFAAALDDRLKALILLGADPLLESPTPAKAREALGKLDFLVALEMFPTESAWQADVVLPLATLPEQNATFTNIEGRRQRGIRALARRGASRPAWQTFDDLAGELGSRLGYSTDRDVSDAIREALAAIEPVARPGLKRVETTAGPAPDGNFPLLLYTGRQMFDHGPTQSRCAALWKLAGDAFVELHPAEAESLGVAEGERVRIATANGELHLQAHISSDTPEGTAFVPRGFPQAPVQSLLGAGAYVVPAKVSKL